MFDLGTVSEDAVAIAPDTMTVNGADTVFTGRQHVGLGELDTERTDVGIFNAETDDIGILGDRPDSSSRSAAGPSASRRSAPARWTSGVPIFPWGDLSARCTNGNGVLDTEDLDGDRLLNATGTNENVFRYVVDLAGRQLLRARRRHHATRRAALAAWKLYRIPLRAPTATISTPTHAAGEAPPRITLATPPDAGDPDIVARLAMARHALRRLALDAPVGYPDPRA